MALNINDLIYDYKNNSLDKIIYKMEGINSYFGRKILIYNPYSSNPLQKFWLYIERCKITYVSKTKISVALSISDVTQKLISFMNDLTDKIKETLKSTLSSTNTVFNKLTLSDTYAPILDLMINSDSIIFNKNNDLCFSIEEVKKIIYCGVFIELDQIHLLNDCALPSWKILQLKELDVVDMKQSFFNSIGKFPVISSQSYSIPSPPPLSSFNNTQNIHHETNNIAQDVLRKDNNIPLPPPQFNPAQININNQIQSKFNKLNKVKIEPSFVPSLSDLQNALMNLKKNIIIPQEKTPEPTQEKIQLKKVIPHEARQMVDILKEEYIETQRILAEKLKKDNEKIDIININDSFVLLKKIKKYSKRVLKYKKLEYENRITVISDISNDFLHLN